MTSLHVQIIDYCNYNAFAVSDTTFYIYEMNILREVVKGKLSNALRCNAQDLGTFTIVPLYEPNVKTKKLFSLMVIIIYILCHHISVSDIDKL